MPSATSPQLSHVSPDWASSPDRDDEFQSLQVAKSNSNNDKEQPRRPSFGFLRRQRSSEARSAVQQRSTSASGRSVSGRSISGVSITGKKLSKKQKEQDELLRQQKEAAALPKQPPRLPSHPPLPRINTFASDETRPDSVAIVSNQLHGDYRRPSEIYGRPSVEYKMIASQSYNIPPVPPIPDSSLSPPTRHGESMPSYERTESMTHRGRYSYASSAVSTMTLNSPRRMRRRKDPTPFNILVIGATGAGKTSFIDFLRTSLALPAKKRHQIASPPTTTAPPDSPFTCHYLESEMDGERIGVTLWDSQGLEKNIVDLQLREMTTFLESKFEETFVEEQKVVRTPGVRDSHIHCCFLILDPARLDANMARTRKAHGVSMNRIKHSSEPRLVGGLDEDLDLQVIRTLQSKTTVIPVISKADTITSAHMLHLKRVVWNSLKLAKIDPLEALNLTDDDSDTSSQPAEPDKDDYHPSYPWSQHTRQHSSSNNAPVDDDENSGSLIDNLADHSSSSSDLDPDLRTSTPATSPQQLQQPSDTSGARSPSQQQPHRRTASTMSATLSLTRGTSSADDTDHPYIPLSILSPDSYEPGAVGRRFPWGFADPYNPEHCDFVRLRDSVFSEWRAELREASREMWYEGWRTSRLKKRGGGLGGVKVGVVGSPAGTGIVTGANMAASRNGGQSGAGMLSPSNVSIGTPRGVTPDGSPGQRGLYRGVGVHQ